MERKSAQIFSNCKFEEGSTTQPTPAKTESLEVKMSKQNIENLDFTPENFDRLQKESLSVQDQLKQLVDGFEYFGISYDLAKDIFTEQNLSIHQVKARCKKAYESNSFMQVSVNYLLNIIFGDKPGVKSENRTLEIYSKKWSHFSGKKKADREGVRQAIITGDGYVHKKKGKLGTYKYRNIENSEDMYIDWNYAEGRPNRYIERMYFTESQAKKLGLKTFTIQLPYGMETIVGIEYSADEIIHYKFLENRWGLGYGRTPIASVINDISIINRMERSIAVISMYKAIPKKLIFPEITDRENVMNDKEVGKVKKVLQQARDYESPVLGAKFGSINLTDGGQALDLSPYLDYFKRKVSMVLSPEFIVHGELVNRSTSREQKQMFYLSVVAIRDEFWGDLDESTHEGIIASLKALQDDQNKIVNSSTFEYKFGNYDVELVEERMARLMNEWNNGTIRLNEYRKELDYDDDEEYGELYKWETDANNSVQVVEKLK